MPAAGPNRLAAALLGLGAGLAPGGCGGAEPAPGSTPALSRSPAHAEATETDRPSGIEPPGGRESDAEGTAEEEAPAQSEGGMRSDIAEGPVVVPFVALESQQIAGAKIIEPSTHDARAMAAAGRQVLGVVELCLDAKGAPIDVTPVRSTGYPDYDARIKAGIERWRFRPHLVGEKPVPVCSSVTIHYRPSAPPPSPPPPRKPGESSGG